MQAWDLGAHRVLEIGCGLALASMVVHRRGGEVTASDRHPLAADFLRANLLLNHLPTMPYCTGNWETKNLALGRFDLIIGSDLLYEPDQTGQLPAFIERHAERAAEVLIIDPDRGNRVAFKRSMAMLGFGLTETRLLAPLHDGTAFAVPPAETVVRLQPRFFSISLSSTRTNMMPPITAIRPPAPIMPMPIFCGSVVSACSAPATLRCTP
jgi:SAM-dependent methyltransferase